MEPRVSGFQGCFCFISSQKLACLHKPLSQKTGQAYSSVIEYIPSMAGALDSIPSTEGRKEGKGGGREELKAGLGAAKESRFQVCNSKEVVWEGIEKRARLGK